MLKRLLAACALPLCLAGNMASADTPSYPTLFVDDVQYVLSSPARWDRDDWHTLGWASVAVVAHNQPQRSGQARVLPLTGDGGSGCKLAGTLD